MTLHPAVLWRATRAYSLPASVVPVLLGTVLAFRGDGGTAQRHFDGTLFLVVLLGSILAHFGANVLNDYFDFILGVDTRPEHGSGVLTGGHMTAPQTLVFGLALLVGAAGCGLFVGVNRVAVVVPLALLGLGCAVLYPAVLKKYALGDLLIVLAFGLGLTLGAYGVQAGSLAGRAWWQVSLFAVPVCLLVDAILHANNLRDASDDRAAKVHTMATVLSARGARWWHQFLLFGPLGFVCLGVAARLLPLWSLGSLLTFPLVLRAYRSGSVPETAQTHLVFGLLYAASFLPAPVFI